MNKPILTELSYDQLVCLAERLRDEGLGGHIHTATSDCKLKEKPLNAIILESPTEDEAYIYYSADSIENLAKPLAIMLQGKETVPEDHEMLESPSSFVQNKIERHNAGLGHFHVLAPDCVFNAYPGKWTIIFEDRERGMDEISYELRPLTDIRAIEWLVYRDE